MSLGAKAVLSIMVFSLIVLFLASLLVGALGIGVPGELASTVIRLRLLRGLLAISVGGLLGLAGLLTQYSVSNLLATPDILGVLQGAFTASIIVAIVYRGSPPLGAPVLAGFLGGLAAYALTTLLASRLGFTGSGLVLAGIAVASMLAGASTLLTFLAQVLAGLNASLLLLGTFAYATETRVLIAYATLLASVIVTALSARGLDALSYGDEAAASMGFSPRRVRLVATGVAALASSVTVYAAGIVYFVSLMAPNAARLLLGGHPSRTIPGSILVGALIALGADIATRLIGLATGGGEIPSGLVTTIIGGAFLAYILLKIGVGEAP